MVIIMFGPKELDLRNTYNPNLQEIKESAERTYGEANSFYRKEELYLKDVERRIMSGELSSEKDIYDECHAIASDLAKCCEMYLKALYIYEHNIPGNQIDELWEKLKNSEFKTDERGNLIYVTPAGEITFVRYDDNGYPIKDSNGKLIYFDKNNNVYTENSRGSKIKRNGHQLDRLIELLSLESQILLELRMLSIPMETTEKNSSVSILDLLQKNGVLPVEKQITSEKYHGWLDQHKKTFEEARYSGEKNSEVNVEFMYHLATQIKAVVQYEIDPKNNQEFDVTDEDISKLPSEIEELVPFNPDLLSGKLIKLIISDENIKKKTIDLFSIGYFFPSNISPKNFCNMVKMLDQREILYVAYMCYANIISKNNKFIKSEKNKKISEIADRLRYEHISPDTIVELCCQIKSIFGFSIGSDSFVTLFENVLKTINKPSYYTFSLDSKRKLNSINNVSPNEIINIL